MGDYNEAIFNRKTGICPVCGEESDIFIFYEGKVVGCRHCGVHIPKRTNADRIRAMSDEELAKLFNPKRMYFYCPVLKDIWDDRCATINCYDCFFRWLKQEVSDEK